MTKLGKPDRKPVLASPTPLKLRPAIPGPERANAQSPWNCDRPENAGYWPGGWSAAGEKGGPLDMGALKFIACAAAFMSILAGPVRADSHMPTLPAPQVADHGMYTQEWFYDGRLDLRKDLAASQKEGKRLVLLWEQKECDNCKTMHEVNLRIPRVVEKIKTGFNVIRLDVWGSRKIADLDGSVLTERELAEKNEVAFTPTLQFLPESPGEATGKSGRDADVFRSEGYFKPFHFYFLFHYVQTRGYESQPSFQRWLSEIGRGLGEKNIHYDLWADSLPPDLPEAY